MHEGGEHQTLSQTLFFYIRNKLEQVELGATEKHAEGSEVEPMSERSTAPSLAFLEHKNSKEQ
jgi:hypothetical protein